MDGIESINESQVIPSQVKELLGKEHNICLNVYVMLEVAS